MFADFNFGEWLANNQFITGGALLALCGWAVVYLRAIPGNIFRFCKRRVTVTLDIEDRDEAFKWVSLYFAKHQKKMRDVSVVTRHKSKLYGDDETEDFSPDQSKDNRPNIFLTPAPGTHFSWFAGRPMLIYRKRNEGGSGKGGSGLLGDLGNMMRSEGYTVIFFSRNQELPRLLLEKARDVALPRDNKIDVRVAQTRWYGHWELADRIRPRSIESVILADDEHLKVLDNIREFLSSYKWYTDLGIPYRRGYLLYGDPGNGKCLGKGTPVLMFDGTIKPVEEVKSGDLLMGPDSTARRVLGTTRGRERMYRVHPVKGEPYEVNESHVLSLQMSRSAGGHRRGGVVNIPVHEWLKKSKKFKHYAKGWRTGVDFQSQPVKIDPYLFGVWLGDGTNDKPDVTTGDADVAYAVDEFCWKNGHYLNAFECHGNCITLSVSGTQYDTGGSKRKYAPNILREFLKEHNLFASKHIPYEYKVNNRQVRLEVLAGLMDTDGSENYGGFDYITKSKKLADDLAYLARSLGFAAYVSRAEKKCCNPGYEKVGTYYRVLISGDLSVVPVRLNRKKCQPRRQKKSVLRTGITLKDIGEGDYYGFELDGDGLFLLGDFTVTHNTSLVAAVASALKMNIYVLSLQAPGMNDSLLVELLTSVSSNSIILMEDVDCAFEKRKKKEETSDKLTFSGLLNALDGVGGKDGRIIFMTTNHKDKLDPALIRPGRIDYEVRIRHAVQSQVRKLFERFYASFRHLDPDLVEGFVSSIPDHKYSMAKLQGHLMNYKDNPWGALAYREELDKEEQQPVAEPEEKDEDDDETEEHEEYHLVGKEA